MTDIFRQCGSHDVDNSPIYYVIVKFLVRFNFMSSVLPFHKFELVILQEAMSLICLI